ncbi:unknown [Bacteroides sp. CAG:1060]|nr:unknown [Bacteroides sp. CAG:1060]
MFTADAAVNANNSSQQPPNWATRISLRNSVPETASWGTEYACGAQNRLLGYAAHLQRHSVHENPLFLHGRRFQRNSVLKTGFYGTEEIFGTKNPLLWYAAHFPCGAGGRKTTPERTTIAQNNHRRKTITGPQNDHRGTTITRPQNDHTGEKGTRGAATKYSSRLQPSQCVTAETLTCYSSKRLFSRA